MIIISHRGLLDGPNPAIENSPGAIEAALGEFFVVEVDIRMVDGKLWLGHDEPQYEVSEDLIHNPDIIWHAKDRLALHYLAQRDVHHFWHQDDDYTYTSHGWVWAYPGQLAAGRQCIAVMPEVNFSPEIIKDSRFSGVCTDYPRLYHEALNM